MDKKENTQISVTKKETEFIYEKDGFGIKLIINYINNNFSILPLEQQIKPLFSAVYDANGNGSITIPKPTPLNFGELTGTDIPQFIGTGNGTILNEHFNYFNPAQYVTEPITTFDFTPDSNGKSDLKKWLTITNLISEAIIFASTEIEL